MFQCELVLGWLFAITCGVSTVYGIYTVYRTGGRQFNKAENVIYGTVSRFVWGLALAWVIYVCHRGYGSEFCRSFFIFPWFAVLVLVLLAFVLLAAVAVLVVVVLAAPVAFVLVLVLAAVAVAVSVVVVVVVVVVFVSFVAHILVFASFLVHFFIFLFYLLQRLSSFYFYFLCLIPCLLRTLLFPY